MRRRNEVTRADIVLTKHAIRRMLERGCDPDYVMKVLHTEKRIVLMKNRRGYEIILPYKGRLVGDFDKKDGKRFIVKSFLYLLALENRTSVRQIHRGRVLIPRYLMSTEGGI